MLAGLKTFILHLRLPMQVTLAPFFVVGASFAEHFWTAALIIPLLFAHIALYGGCTAFNSYYDKDNGPISFMKKPLAMAPWMLPASVILQGISVGYFFILDMKTGVISASMFFLGAAYSHPLVRLKKRLWGSLFTIAVGQGGLAPLLGFYSAGGQTLNASLLVCLAGSMILAVGFYFVTQVFQIEEDRVRGDRTLGTLMGPRKTLYISWVFIAIGGALFLSTWLHGILIALPAVGFAPVSWFWARKIEDWSTEKNHDLAMFVAVVFSLATLGFLLFSGLIVAAPVDVHFTFYEAKTRKALLHGTERIEEHGNEIEKRTTYIQRNQIAQIEFVRFDSQSFTLSRYEYKDKIYGESAKAVVKGDVADLAYRAVEGKTLQSKQIAWTPQTISGKSIPEMIQRHWTDLLDGKALSFDLYVPYRMDTIGFRVRVEHQTDDEMTFIMEASNFIVRLLAPNLHFIFESAKQRRLLRYVGPSIVVIDGKKDLEVTVEFDYPALE